MQKSNKAGNELVVMFILISILVFAGTIVFNHFLFKAGWIDAAFGALKFWGIVTLFCLAGHVVGKITGCGDEEGTVILVIALVIIGWFINR